MHRGIQIGVFNGANDMTGFQLGLINVTHTMMGVQVGLVNVISDNDVPFIPLGNGNFGGTRRPGRFRKIDAPTVA